MIVRWNSIEKNTHCQPLASTSTYMYTHTHYIHTTHKHIHTDTCTHRYTTEVGGRKKRDFSISPFVRST